LVNGNGAISRAPAGLPPHYEDLLRLYPNDGLAAEAQYRIGESFIACAEGGNPAAADSVYSLVVARYPKSEFGGISLYKQAEMIKATKPDSRKVLYQRIVCEFSGEHGQVHGRRETGGRPALQVGCRARLSTQLNADSEELPLARRLSGAGAVRAACRSRPGNSAASASGNGTETGSGSRLGQPTRLVDQGRPPRASIRRRLKWSEPDSLMKALMARDGYEADALPSQPARSTTLALKTFASRPTFEARRG